MEVVAFVFLQIPVAIVAAVVGARLLGVRRSWVAIVLSGAVGWLSGVLIVLGLDGWDGDTGGVSGRALAITVLMTMVAAVALDLVARPGTLASGDRAGLLVVPRPFRDVRRRIAPYARYREIAAIARRNGLHATAAGRHHRLVDRSLSVAIRTTLEQAGIVFVKLGQMASTRADLLPSELTDELRHLQSRVEPLPQPVMQQQLESELGVPLEEHFTDFDWHPIGSASVAQAYTARLRATGEPVIVKIQRPGMDELVARDGATVTHLARTLEQRTPLGRDLHVEEIATDFVRAMRDELDFVSEASNAIDIAAGTNGAPGVRIPKVHTQLVTRRVLVEERFVGASVTDPGRIEQLGLDRTAVADRLVEAVMNQILYGHFHADPHPGNVLLLDDGALGLIDFGLTGRLDATQRSALIDVMVSLATGDAGALREGIEQVAIVGDAVPDVELERALAHFVSLHVAPGRGIGPEALNEIVVLLSAFDIRLPKELTMCFRALAMLDGTTKVIDPGYALVPAMRRLFGDAASPTGTGPGQDLLHDELLRQLPRLRRLPVHLERVASSAARGQLRTKVSLFSGAEDVRVFMTAVNRIVLALTGGLVLVGAALLLAADPGGAETSLPDVIAYVGLALGSVLVLRVVAAVVRDGYG